MTWVNRGALASRSQTEPGAGMRNGLDHRIPVVELEIIGNDQHLLLKILRIVSGCHQFHSIQRSFLEGFLSNALNPKAIVFYMAFLPQFIDPGRSALRQSMFLACIHFSVAMAWQCLLASAVDRTRRIITKPFIRRSLDGLTGTVMLFFGASLLFLKK